MRWKWGFKYQHGKVLIYRADKKGEFKRIFNPGEEIPNWAVDIREIIAMVFAGVGGLGFLCMGHKAEAQTILVGLMLYATGRTVPGGKPQITPKQVKEIISEVVAKLEKKGSPTK